MSRREKVPHFTPSAWVDVLRRGKSFYRLGELLRVAGLGEAAGRRAAHRLSQRGCLAHVGRGLWANLLAPGGPPTLELLAGLLYPPAYISLESGLFAHGLIAQAPHLVSCVTANKTKRFTTPLGTIHYHHLKPALMFGWTTRAGISLGSPEKVVLDTLYLRRQNGRAPDADEWAWSSLDAERLRSLATRFPATVRALLPPDRR